jgi:hypothetical protein
MTDVTGKDEDVSSYRKQEDAGKLEQQALDRNRCGKDYERAISQTTECIKYSQSIGRFTFDCSSFHALMTASRCR